MKKLAFLFNAIAILIALFHFQTCNLSPGCTSQGLLSLRKFGPAFDHQCVTLEGEVTFRLSLGVIKLYIISDSTGEVTVTVPIWNNLPPIHTAISTCGEVREVFSFGNFSWTVLGEAEHNTTQGEAPQPISTPVARPARTHAPAGAITPLHTLDAGHSNDY